MMNDDDIPSQQGLALERICCKWSKLNSLLMVQIHCFKSTPLFWKGFVLQGSKQEVKKVLCLCKNGEKNHGDVPIYLNLKKVTQLKSKLKFLLYFSMNYRDFSVKSKLIISLFQSVKLNFSISMCQEVRFS